MSTQSGYKINNSQNVKSCKIKRSEADNLYKTLTGLIHKQCSPVLFAASLKDAVEEVGFPIDYRPIGIGETLLHYALYKGMETGTRERTLPPEQSSYVKILLDMGTDVNLVDYNTGENALIKFSRDTRPLFQNFERKMSLFHDIVTRTNDINLVSQIGTTALNRFCLGWLYDGSFLHERMYLEDPCWDNHKRYLDALLLCGARIDLGKSLPDICTEEYKRQYVGEPGAGVCINGEQMAEYVAAQTQDVQKEEPENERLER